MNRIKNELRPELTSILGNNPFIGHNSASRHYMFATQLSQRVITNRSDEDRIQTGITDEFGKYTFSVAMPESGYIISVIDRYPYTVAEGGIESNPFTLVIYEREVDKVIDCIQIPSYKSMHQSFGFRYKMTKACMRLRPGEYIEKGTIFADSPAKHDNGAYAQGVELNVCMMTHPAVTEDGVCISETAANSLGFKLYEKARVSTGSSHFPINLYGDPNDPDEYKPFPDIGEYIRPDGLLMVNRAYDYDMAPVDLGFYDVREVRYGFDRPEYVRPGVGKVIDITILKDKNTLSVLPTHMEESMNKYTVAIDSYYQKIVEMDANLRKSAYKRFGEARVEYSPELSNIIVRALAITDKGGDKATERINLAHKKTPIDNYTIEFVIEYDIVPNIGFKVTGRAGDKGVFCKVIPDDHMPVDDMGNRADIIADGYSTLSRMNIGRPIEHYISGSCRDTSKRLAAMFDMEYGSPMQYATVAIETYSDRISSAWGYIMGFYEIVSPEIYDALIQGISERSMIDHMAYIIHKGIYPYIRSDNPVSMKEVIEQLSIKYPVTKTPVTYVGYSGRRVRTKTPIMIAPYYTMLLEKIGDDWSSTSSGKLSIFGILNPTTKSEKTMTPYSASAVKSTGETEFRILVSYLGREAAAEIMDRNNNIAAHRYACYSILTSDSPTNIERIVDRDKIPLGGSRPLQLINLTTRCAGFKFVYIPEEEVEGL